MDFFNSRRQILLRNLKKDNLEAILVTHPTNIRYLSGFSGSSAVLFVTAKNTIILTDSRYQEQVAQETRDLEVIIRPHTKKLPDATAELLSKSGSKTVAIEAEHMTIGLQLKLTELAPKVTLAPVGNLIELQRAIKDPSEVNEIQMAIKFAERAFKMFITTLEETNTEKQMHDALENYIRKAGAKGSAFPSITAVGERSGLPHAPPTDRPLNDGSKLLVDWGADIGYKCDITRTLKCPFGPVPTRRNKPERVGWNFDEIFKAVLSAQEEAVKLLKDGAIAKDIDAAARAALSKGKMRDHPTINLSEYFTHGLGHGIGLDVHEYPNIRTGSEDVLQTGMVVTIEPAVYIPEWGGLRLEDNYLILKDGAKRLTTLPHDPNAIG
ncbi:MAG: M24 family metallopeptidase [Fimbriiglobus sp.]